MPSIHWKEVCVKGTSEGEIRVQSVPCMRTLGIIAPAGIPPIDLLTAWTLRGILCYTDVASLEAALLRQLLKMLCEEEGNATDVFRHISSQCISRGIL
jgi:hypothetical protein